VSLRLPWKVTGCFHLASREHERAWLQKNEPPGALDGSQERECFCTAGDKLSYSEMESNNMS
jgi:hypothetical protein